MTQMMVPLKLLDLSNLKFEGIEMTGDFTVKYSSVDTFRKTTITIMGAPEKAALVKAVSDGTAVPQFRDHITSLI
jgi:hypothetical protein